MATRQAKVGKSCQIVLWSSSVLFNMQIVHLIKTVSRSITTAVRHQYDWPTTNSRLLHDYRKLQYDLTVLKGDNPKYLTSTYDDEDCCRTLTRLWYDQNTTAKRHSYDHARLKYDCNRIITRLHQDGLVTASQHQYDCDKTVSWHWYDV